MVFLLLRVMMPCSGIRLLPEDPFRKARTVHPAQLPASIPARRASGAAQASPARQAAAGIAKTAIEGNRRRMKRPFERVSFPFHFWVWFSDCLQTI
jgi:hypothetical protein